MKKSAYIITKPLQYINATNIPDELEKDCFLIDLFSNSDRFYEVIAKYASTWNNVKIFRTRYSSLLNIIRNKKKYSTLFIDSDHGILITFLFLLLLPTVKIFTYEEGFGSYRYVRENRTISEKLKSYIYALMGCKNWLGGNICTSGQYLYHPEVFNSLIPNASGKKLLFRSSFNVHLNMLKEVNHLFNFQSINHFKNKKVIIYLSTWSINSKINQYLKMYPDYIKILKPHPHIKDYSAAGNVFDTVIENSLPAEILLNGLINVCKDLVIIHENSSSLMYLPQNGFKEINISENSAIKNVYSNILEIIRKNHS